MEFLKSTDSKVIKIDSCMLKFNCDNTCCLISSPNVYSHFAELHYVNMKEKLLFPPVIINIDTFNLCVYFIQSMVTLYGYLVTDKHHTAEQTQADIQSSKYCITSKYGRSHINTESRLVGGVKFTVSILKLTILLCTSTAVIRLYYWHHRL